MAHNILKTAFLKQKNCFSLYVNLISTIKTIYFLTKTLKNSYLRS